MALRWAPLCPFVPGHPRDDSGWSEVCLDGSIAAIALRSWAGHGLGGCWLFLGV